MSAAEIVLTAPWIIPIRPSGAVLRDHAIVVRSDRIIDVLPQCEVQSKYPEFLVEHFASHALIPGLVNAHTHAAMNLLRGIADDRPLMDWLNNHIWPLEKMWVGEEFVQDGVDLAIAEMLRGGVTSFNDMYFFPEVTSRRAIHSGIRAKIGLIVVDFPTSWARNPEEYFTKGLAVKDDYQHHPNLSFAFAPHAPYTVSDEPLSRIGTLAHEMDIPIHIHLHETQDEIRQSLEVHGMRPIERLRRLDLLGPQLMAVHMTQLEDDEIALILESGVSVIHCPESNLKLGSGFCPVSRLLKEGINIGLGTDGAASNNDLDLFGEMRTAALLAKGLTGDASTVPAESALEMATLGGAKALGLDDKTGSLESGKLADITAIRLDLIETQPLFHPISDLVYSASRHQVTDVWVGGRRLLKARKLTTLDEHDLLMRVEYWRERLSNS
mgnify:CR=1 FL=1